MASQSISNDAIARMRAPWEMGDFGAISREVGAPAAAEFAAALDVRPGEKVLDVACGTGAVSIPLALRGAELTGLDISKRLLAEARERAVDAGIRISLDEGLAEELPYPNAAYDWVVSMFGVMFSSQPNVTAAEMARVLRSGGGLCLGNWTRAGFSGRFPDLVAPFVSPPPPEAPSPYVWSDKATVVELLEPWFRDIETERVRIEWHLDLCPIEAARFFMRNSGQFVMLSSFLKPDRFSELSEATEQLWIKANQATDPGRTVIPNEYMKVSATRC